MDDPTPRSKKDRETECVFWGSRSQARAPFYFICAKQPETLGSSIFSFPGRLQITCRSRRQFWLLVHLLSKPETENGADRSNARKKDRECWVTIT